MGRPIYWGADFFGLTRWLLSSLRGYCW